ncbi:MAG: TrkA family potassium uptake protein [Clostridiaceae bacterium]|nr:TrkA family potassium uptake protein [Clostridiaceae bacterium]
MKSFAVIGVGRFGRAVATTLYTLGCEVLVIDKNEQIIQSIADEVTHAVTVETLDEATLKALGIRNYDAVIVAIGDELEASMLVSLMLKELGVKYIISKAQGELHAKLLTKIGIDKVILPERDIGERVANTLVNTNIIDFIELSPEYSIAEISPPSQWVVKTLVNLDLRTKHRINVISIINGKEVNVNPRPEYTIKNGDRLAVIGCTNDINSLNKTKI